LVIIDNQYSPVLAYAGQGKLLVIARADQIVRSIFAGISTLTPLKDLWPTVTRCADPLTFRLSEAPHNSLVRVPLRIRQSPSAWKQ
jgi:hypothetical protein